MVSSFALQTDGKIVVGGSFATLGAQPHYCFGRVNDQGSAESTPSVTGGSSIGVDAMAIQPDGKIVIAGGFNFNVLQRTNIARLNPDLSLDTAFNSGANSYVRTMALQPDGRILVAGDFTILAGQPCSHIGRLKADGSFDDTFNSGTNTAAIYTVALQPDGKVLVGGVFTALQGQARTNIARLNADGSLDTEFSPAASGSPIPGAGVYSCALQADGKILVAGAFRNLGGLSRTNLGRLTPDGAGDTGFVANALGNSVLSVALQEEGKILVSGSFTNLAGQSITNVARLNNTAPADQSLSFDGSTITWQQGGTSPEAWRTTFECSTDGTNWTFLGSGTRSLDGWQLSGLSLSNSGTIRARAFISGGNGSVWYAESTRAYSAPAPPLRILAEDPVFGFGANGFAFRASGPTGQVVIEVSTNLLNWFPLSTNTIGIDSIYFSDPDSLTYPLRFYRARMR